MKLVVSRIQNGPQLSDNLANGLVGFDLSSFGIAGGSPGDTTYFNLYISVQKTDEEKALFDYIENVGLYVRSSPTYGGDYTSAEDFADIKQLGDQGNGLAFKNPLTGNYDLQVDSSHYSSESGLLILKKEMAIFQDRSDLTQITNITMQGFDDTALASGSTGYTIKTGSNRFNSLMVGLRIWNATLTQSAVILEYVSPTEVIVDRVHGWATGNLIYIKRLIEPHDGVLAIKENNGIILGDCFKLECRYTLPNNYQRTKIKQFNLEIISGSEGA